MSDKPWKTSISKATAEETLLRGYDLLELVKKKNFTQTIFLTLNGNLPSEKEERMLNAMLVACVDHGIAPPSVIATRTVLSGGNSLNAAVGAGVLALGDSHGGAIEQCARILQDIVKGELDLQSFVKESIEKKYILPGYGHKIYKDTDPRSATLFKIAKETQIYNKHCIAAEDLTKAIEKEKGKKLCLNVDGAIAAIISDMGFDYRLGKGFFIISRIVGLVAHAHEEMSEKPFRRLDENSTEYTGQEKRAL